MRREQIGINSPTCVCDSELPIYFYFDLSGCGLSEIDDFVCVCVVAVTHPSDANEEIEEEEEEVETILRFSTFAVNLPRR